MTYLSMNDFVDLRINALPSVLLTVNSQGQEGWPYMNELNPIDLQGAVKDLSQAFDHYMFVTIENTIKVISPAYATTDNDREIIEAVLFEWLIQKLKSVTTSRNRDTTHEDIKKYLEVAMI